MSDKKSQQRMAIAIATLIVVIIVSLVSYPAVVGEASKYGHGGVAGWIYPVSTSGVALLGAFLLMFEASSGWRLSVRTWILVMAGLGIDIVAMCWYY